MVSVKIECDCGQRYAFDVEPVGGRMASTVACPSCGVDGTTTANAIIASKLAPAPDEPPPPVAPAAPVAGGARLNFSAAERQAPQVPAGVKVDARTLGLLDRDAAATEARAKISWGDSKEDVVKYLMLQNYSVPEAQELVEVFYKERLAALRVKGARKIFIGIGMMCVPVVAWFARLQMISLKLMGGAVGVGFWGIFVFVSGVLMLVAPKGESGDVAD